MGDNASGWRAYTDPGESVLWESRPSNRLIALRKIDLFLIPFSFVWSIGALNAAVPMLGSGGIFSAFSLFFILAAIYTSFGRFILDWYIRRHTVYALTDKRAFIAKSAFGRKLRDLPITTNLSIEFNDAPQGSVWFDGRPSLISGMQSIGAWHGEDGGFTFREIDDPKNIYDLIQSIKRTRK